MNNIRLRKYQEKDFAALNQIWKECGWLPEKMDSTMGEIIGATHHVIGELAGNVEGVAMSTDGDLLYLDKKIKASLITAVTVSLIGRKTGLAKQCVARLLAEIADKGYPLTVLGMFEQGFYNRLGFGTGSYFKQINFDPADLLVTGDFRIPSRLTHNDYQKVHQSRLNRLRTHASFNVTTPVMTKSEMDFMKKSFGLGYYNEKGELTHHIWINPTDMEFGPINISWMSYQNYDQFLELIALIRSFNDQIRSVSLTEPANIQFLDLIKKPIRKKAVTKGSKYQSNINSCVYWQLRILDLQQCLQHTHLNTPSLEFNLTLHDPLTEYLHGNSSKWQGCSGEYHVKLDKNSEAGKGFIKGLPHLEAGIGAFSRMWMGIKPATGLAVTDQLQADQKLLNKLDKAFSLPDPQPDWWF